MDPLITLGQSWKVLPQPGRRLAESDTRLPEEPRTILQRLLAKAFAGSARCVNGGADALAAIERQGIPCTAFKGLASVAFLI